MSVEVNGTPRYNASWYLSPRVIERFSWVLVPAIFLLCWEFASQTGLVDARIIPAPSSVLLTIISMSKEGSLVRDTGVTLARFIVGMIVGTIPGVVIGLTMGMFRWVRIALDPLVAALYPVPRIALFPLILILVGMNETSNIIMIALGPFFTMLITAMAAVLNIDPIYRDVARNFGTGTKDLYTRVMLPAAMPVLVGGLKVSIGLALLGTVAAEFLVCDNGLGHVIWNSWQLLSLSQSMAGLVVTALVGAFFYMSMDVAERWLVPWQRNSEQN